MAVREESTRQSSAPITGQVVRAGSTAELIATAADAEVAVVEVAGIVDGVSNLRLGIGQMLRGSAPSSTLRIAPGAMIGGGLRAHGAGTEPVEIHGAVDGLEIRNEISLASTGFVGI